MAQDKRIIEIDENAAELTQKFKALLNDKRLTAGQDKVTLSAYEGLLFWRRTDLALMMKEFVNARAGLSGAKNEQRS